MPIDPDRQREFALDVARTLRKHGYRALWAGGCVRDRLLGLAPKDYDVATNATPDEIRRVFGHRRTVAIGAAFGVITVLGPKQAGQIEVATFRRDAAYSDGRHPDAVAFTNAEQDALRRDFTINGLFYDPVEEQVIDYVGGQDDLRRRIVRAIGDPRQRFAEDKLRMLRGVRFASTFGFELDPDTLAAIRQMAGEIGVVSAERIAMEMRRMLVDPRRAAAVTMLHASGLMDAVWPELQPIAATGGDAWRATLDLLVTLDQPSFPLALAAAMLCAEDQSAANNVCRRWKLSNDETLRTTWLVANEARIDDARTAPWTRLQRLLIQPGIDELLALAEARARAGQCAAAPAAYCRERLSAPPDEIDPPPLLTGDDLIAHGIPQGKIYKALLDEIRDAQLERHITTTQDALALVDRLLSDGAKP